MNILSKDMLFYRFYPEPILQYVPAYSYTETRYTSLPSLPKQIIKVNPKIIKRPGTNETIKLTGSDPGDSLVISGQTSSSGGTAVKVVIKVPASYVWYTPESYLKEYNVIGWNGSAISKQLFINYGEAEFSIADNSVGVMVGLTTTNNAVKNSHYNFITYAIYGHQRNFSIYVNGSLVNISGTFTSIDKFKIIVEHEGIRFLFNGVEIYYVTCTPEKATYRLDTSLYSSYDKVLNASIKQGSYLNLGSKKTTQYVIINGVSYEVVNGKIFYNGIWYSVITSCFVYINNLLYVVQNGKIFYEGTYFNVINGTVTVNGIYGGSYAVTCSPIVIIKDKVYSILTRPIVVNGVEYPNGYWILGLGNTLMSQGASSISNNLDIGCKLEPYYDLTNELKIGSSLIYSGGSYLSCNLELGNNIRPNYGLHNELHLGCNLYYKGYSALSVEFTIGSELVAGGLTPSIPPTLVCGFEIGGTMRNYFIEDPSLFIIT